MTTKLATSAARTLRAIKSDKRSAASRENGKLGGRHVKHFEVIFDNGGGTTLQVGKRGYAHYYDLGADAARDVKVLLGGGNTGDWDGNDQDSRMVYNYDAELNGGYRWQSVDDVKQIVAKGTLEPGDSAHGWKNAEEFYAALGVDIVH